MGEITDSLVSKRMSDILKTTIPNSSLQNVLFFYFDFDVLEKKPLDMGTLPPEGSYSTALY